MYCNDGAGEFPIGEQHMWNYMPVNTKKSSADLIMHPTDDLWWGRR